VIGNGKRVLFLDDDPAIGALFGRTVREAGYTVDIVATEEEALQLGTAHCYALLVIDLALGSWNGLDILEQLAPKQKAAGLVLVSAHFPDNGEVEVDARTVHMVAKPWRARGLLDTLDQALAQAPVLAR
jgi:DNA-binding response OmpR family regulator